MVKVTFDRGHSSRKDFFDLNFQSISVKNGKSNNLLFQKPKQWDQMIQIAKCLSDDFPFVRVDLYEVNNDIYFSELTFTPANGMDSEIPKDWDLKMGQLFDLSIYNK